MTAPYGRVIVLHIGIFAGAGALILLGDPMIGVLALILLRVIWGIHVNMNEPQGRYRLAPGDFHDAAQAAAKAGGV